jgi:hypothetical protein
MHATLVAWLVSAILSWTPMEGKSQERIDQLTSIAEDIVDVVYDEKPAFHGPHALAHTALLLASIGSLETRFISRIQRGECKHGECDGGQAYCYLQIHTNAGLELLESNPREVVGSPGGITGADLLADPRLCMHVGLHMLRYSLRAYSTGDKAFAQARDYLTLHPAPIADADVEP